MTDPMKALLALPELQATAFPPTSRYHGVETTVREAADGSVQVYLRRRFAPDPDALALLQTHRVALGDRLDLLASTYLNDPELFWRICDGNAGTCTPLAPEDRPPPRSQELFSELLFSYRLNARSVLFVGLTDVQTGGDTLDPIARRYFMKASYAWLF